jgi:hypothetical protein
MPYLIILALLLVAVARPAFAADGCSQVAAKVAEKGGMATEPQKNNLVSMTQPDGDYGARIICNGSLGITFHPMSPEHPPDDCSNSSHRRHPL